MYDCVSCGRRLAYVLGRCPSLLRPPLFWPGPWLAIASLTMLLASLQLSHLCAHPSPVLPTASKMAAKCVSGSVRKNKGLGSVLVPCWPQSQGSPPVFLSWCHVMSCFLPPTPPSSAADRKAPPKSVPERLPGARALGGGALKGGGNT